MKNNKHYKISDMLIVRKRKDGYLLYNSLYGNALIVNGLAYQILLEFAILRSVTEVYLKYANKKDLELLINNFISRFFIIEQDSNIRDLIDFEKSRRLKNIESGEYIRSIQLVVTNECNFDCKYCFMKTIYNSKERHSLKQSYKNKNMRFEVARCSIDSLLKIAKNNNHKNIVVEFFGGEPLCNWRVISKILDNYKEVNSQNPLILYSMTTNASLITEDIAKKLGEYDVHTALSYDSGDSSARIDYKGYSLKTIIKEKLDILSRNNVVAIINATMSSQTIDEFDPIDLVDFAYDNNVKTIVLTHDLDIEFYNNKSNIECAIDKTLELIYYAIEKDIDVTGIWYQIFKQINNEQEINLYTGCKACVACGCKFSVEPTGDVFPCKSSSRYLGTINNIEGILSSEAFYDYTLNAYKTTERCIGCELEGFCSGLCNGSLESKYNDIFRVEENACELFKRITEDVLINYPLDRIDHIFMQ